MDDLRRWLAARIEPPNREDVSRPPRTAGRIFGFIADACGILSVLVAAIIFFIGDTWRGAILAGALSLLVIIFIALNFDLQRRYSREARRTRAALDLASCHNHLTRAAVAIGQGDDSKFGSAIWAATVSLAEAFEVATGRSCRTAVMDIGAESTGGRIEEARVKVLTRNKQPDYGSREAQLPDFSIVKDNSDYLQVMRGQEVFFSNDLSKEHGYINSNFAYPMKESDYPYRSTIVWPIAGPHLDPTVTRPQIIGFLCVDSRSPRTFDRSLDVPTGKAVASAMYSALSLYRARREADAASQITGGTE